MKNKFILGLLSFALIAIVSCGDDEETVAPEEVSAVVGTWTLSNSAGSLAVGPNAGSGEWWASPDPVRTERACLYDDTYEFTADGTFVITMGDQTWLEGWQNGGNAEACGAPVAPFVGGSYTYTFDETANTLTVTGSGAFIGLAKATNTGEISTVADAPSSVTYDVFSITSSSAELRIKAGDAYWTYKLSKN
ncbi:MAG: hypothetical protein ACJAS3_002406 [Roseivirga sp.]|jgi:hypothetical protein